MVCLQITTLLSLLFGLAGLVVALVTDYWCEVSTEGLVGIQYQKENNYRFGLWRRCYDSIPDSYRNNPDIDRSGSNCIWIYKDLVPDDFDELSSDEKKAIHLKRSVIGLSITASTLIIAALLVWACASCPGDCRRVKQTTLDMVLGVILLFATAASFASIICFVAAVDVEEDPALDYNYWQWSFFVHLFGCLSTMVACCFALIMLKKAAKDERGMKYYYDM